ncbi:MAG: halocyanin domain-containing protein [Halobacteriota archaeon]
MSDSKCRVSVTSTRRTFLRVAGGGVAALASTGTVAAQSDSGAGDGGSDDANVRPDFGDWLEGVDGGYMDARGQDQVTVQVGTQGNGGPFAYTPANLWIDPGTTVTFDWVSDTHTVTVESQPNGAGWEGSPSVEDTGFSYEHTFETEGMYEYYCEPHLALGMVGGVAVGDEVPTVEMSTGGGGDGARGVPIPGGAVGSTMLLLFFGFVGATVSFVLGAETYLEIEDRGGIRGAKPEETATPIEERPAAEPVETIAHDDYDPFGTATLIVVYFAILALMWVFMYFVEFLGNGPTVIG